MRTLVPGSNFSVAPGSIVSGGPGFSSFFCRVRLQPDRNNTMSEQTKSGKKDQTVRREVREEIDEEAREGTAEPKYPDPNRDQARGDWDRSGRHRDEEPGREE